MPPAGELKVEVRAGVSKLRQDMAQARQVALREAAQIEREVEASFQRKLTRGERFDRGVSGLLNRGAGLAAKAGAIGLAAYAGFRAGNAIENFASLPLQRAEEERIRREGLTDRQQAAFRQGSLSNIQNLTAVSAIRQQFRTRRADLLAQRQGEIDQQTQGNLFLEGLRDFFGRRTVRNALGGATDRLLFSREDIEAGRGSAFNLADVRVNRIRGEERNLTTRQIENLNAEEEASIRAALRQAFPALNAQFNAQQSVELAQELRRLNETIGNQNLGSKD